jgi:hypothetical protein
MTKKYSAFYLYTCQQYPPLALLATLNSLKNCTTPEEIALFFLDIQPYPVESLPHYTFSPFDINVKEEKISP